MKQRFFLPIAKHFIEDRVDMNLSILKRSLKPFRLISLVATYVLGAGLVQYVRGIHLWSNFIEGVLFLILGVVSLELLKLLYDLNNPKNWPEGSHLNQIRQTRWVLVAVIAVLMTSATVLFFGWMVKKIVSQGLVLLVVTFLFAGFLYYLAKANRNFQPFQIFFETFLFVIIPPALAFFLQSDDLHSFLPLMVLGFVPAYLAYRILDQIARFGEDHRLEKVSFVTQTGWAKGMTFHNALILLTFFLFALVSLIKIPWFLMWPVFLSLPIGLLEIWLMERVRAGGKPLWRVMKFASAMVFFLPVYLLAFAFWIR